jgi:hypothetical protein
MLIVLCTSPPSLPSYCPRRSLNHQGLQALDAWLYAILQGDHESFTFVGESLILDTFRITGLMIAQACFYIWEIEPYLMVVFSIRGRGLDYIPTLYITLSRRQP